ncbi:MAG: RDD family protein [Halioglobus sp.]|nr:RDD family protein [Halioglobus sp.]
MLTNDKPLSPSLLRRLSALIYDTLLVIALVMVINGLALAVVSQISEQDVLSPPLVQCLTALTISGFFCVFWITNGQTLGMQAWRIQLVDFEGHRPNMTKALIRCVGATISAGCLGLGYLWCLVDRNKRYWHDYLSHTELILLPKHVKSNRL